MKIESVTPNKVSLAVPGKQIPSCVASMNGFCHGHNCDGLKMLNAVLERASAIVKGIDVPDTTTDDIILNIVARGLLLLRVAQSEKGENK